MSALCKEFVSAIPGGHTSSPVPHRYTNTPCYITWSSGVSWCLIYDLFRHPFSTVCVCFTKSSSRTGKNVTMEQQNNDSIWMRSLRPSSCKQNNMALIVKGFFLWLVIYHASTLFGFESLQQLRLKSLPHVRDLESHLIPFFPTGLLLIITNLWHYKQFRFLFFYKDFIHRW